MSRPDSYPMLAQIESPADLRKLRSVWVWEGETLKGTVYNGTAWRVTELYVRVGRFVNDDFVEESGLICGGQMDVFIEPITLPPDLFVVGAGHVGQHVARLGHTVGFRVTVLDDREKFASREHFPAPISLVVDDIPGWLQSATLPPTAYVVVVTRGHRHDFDALRALTARELRYLGLIGSRAKVARIFQALEAEGVDPARLARVHSPIGLDIGAVTPEEIAVSIVAELIAVKYGKTSPEGGRSAVPSLKWTPETAPR
jgi:xanthine dehydrogenase accessory factor